MGEGEEEKERQRGWGEMTTFHAIRFGKFNCQRHFVAQFANNERITNNEIQMRVALIESAVKQIQLQIYLYIFTYIHILYRVYERVYLVSTSDWF